MDELGRPKTTYSIGTSGDRLVLYYWGGSLIPRFANLARLNDHGDVIWQAELPGKAPHDCFVKLEREGHSFVAYTYCGYVLRMDGQGRPEQRTLVMA